MEGLKNRFHIVDVFAERRYAGNPLAVVRDAADLDTAAMQQIAREFGFSETTFVLSGANDGGGAGMRVRIFTPTFEIPFAGHPTLGTAFVVREHIAKGRPDAMALALGVGRVPVAFERTAGGELAWLTAPPITLGAKLDPDEIAAIVGLAPADLDSALPVQQVSAGPVFAIAPLRWREALARIEVDLARLRAFGRQHGSTGIYLFAREAEDPANHMRARMFFESAGVREDPATGSATACLGAYLLARRSHGSAFSLRIEQGVELGRPSLLHLDASRERIRVGGRVIETARGELV